MGWKRDKLTIKEYSREVQQDRGCNINEEIKQQEMSGKLEEVESQNREMIKLWMI